MKVAMSDKNFDPLQGCCGESHRKALPEWSRTVVFSSKSVQQNPSYRIDNFYTELSIIRAIGRRGPGSDKTTDISVTNERISTGLRPLYSLSCTLY